MVYVISKGDTPLMPCKPVIARLLLKHGKAKVIKRTPFTIKLLYKTDIEDSAELFGKIVAKAIEIGNPEKSEGYGVCEL